MVTDEREIVGLVSSFDLSRLIENKRFVVKNPLRLERGAVLELRASIVLGNGEHWGFVVHSRVDPRRVSTIWR